MERTRTQDVAKAEPTTPALAAAAGANRPRSLWPAVVILLALVSSLAWSIFLLVAVARVLGIL